ncbi:MULTISPECIES: GNAT family N-acetyltransferase [Streptomyces]|uniref:GNAT family N-acetyltransferase n=1 Tax=Streptomyces siderophoricus TaxID=2802281 RepID=A0ABS1MJ58_9ACTN|nr:GNAT family N-acetyltransferase [Streptomyces sp. 9-7]MBL1088073.1 GNAT family N-acetyltransferase [Streptomyces sp. 9-7]
MNRPSAILRSDQVELRRWRTYDIEILDRLVNESRDHLLPWMPFAASHDRKQGEEFLARCEEEWATGQTYYYAITSGGVEVGSCSLMRRIGPGGLEIGYWLHPDWTGKGLATMAAGALVAAGRRLPGIDRIEIHHDEANAASGAVARRLGFAEVERVSLPDGPETPHETGIDVIWRLQIHPSPAPNACT